MKRLLVNFVAFQVGWFSCVLGASNGYPLAGPIVVLLVTALHLSFAYEPRKELSLILIAAVVGACFDSLVVQTGWIAYPNGILLDGTAPYWIVAMWLLFATTLNVLAWLSAWLIVTGSVSANCSRSSRGWYRFSSSLHL